MDDNKSGMSWLWTLFIILVIWAIFGGGFGNGFGMNRGGNCGEGYGWNGCARVSPCEIERQEIIDSATTQYKVEQQGAATRAAVVESGNAIQEQANRIYIQGIQAELFDAKAKINQLESQAYTKAQTDALASQIASCCCEFNRRLDGVEARMLTKPNLYGVASTCGGQYVPSCSCNCNNI